MRRETLLSSDSDEPGDVNGTHRSSLTEGRSRVTNFGLRAPRRRSRSKSPQHISWEPSLLLSESRLCLVFRGAIPFYRCGLSLVQVETFSSICFNILVGNFLKFFRICCFWPLFLISNSGKLSLCSGKKAIK